LRGGLIIQKGSASLPVTADRLWLPWEETHPGDRLKAALTAAEIVFCDKSAVRWTGLGWKIDYRYLLKNARNSEADQFIAAVLEVARRAVSRH
jgi:hypothetical protein